MHPVLLYKQTAAVHFPSHIHFSLTGYTVHGFCFKKYCPPPAPMHISLLPPSVRAKLRMRSVCLASPALAPRWGSSFWGSRCDLTLDTGIFLLLEKRTFGLLGERKLTVSCKFISNNCCTKGAGKTTFLSTTVSFPPFFFKQKFKYFSYKKVDSVLTLYVAYIQNQSICRFKPRTLYV